MGSVYRTLATVCNQTSIGEDSKTISFPRCLRYPREGRNLGRLFADVVEFDLVDPERNAWNLEKHVRLQS